MSTLCFNTTPPSQVCLLRLSAIGDTCHALALLRALQRAWPQTRFTWIIGTLEATLMRSLLPEIEFITFDKRDMLAELKRLRTTLRARCFDLLLDLQLAIRASLVATQVRATTKLGFDWARARELQWLFTNARIAPRRREHVLDSFMGFATACGVEAGAPRWNVRVPEQALCYARGVLADRAPALIISPCSSHAARDWTPQGYAAVAVYAMRHHRMAVVLSGGRSSREARMGEAIMALARRAAPEDCTAALSNQIGKDTLPELLGLLSQASALISPDSGPVHMASMVGLPVIGLYAATNPSRAGPYYSREWCVDKYGEAAQRFLGRSAARLAWTRKIERPGVMTLIPEAEVIAKLDALMAARKR